MKRISQSILTFSILTIISFLILNACRKDDKESPSASLQVTPQEGTINTFFVFDASGSTDINEITDSLRVRFDFDGDANWDTG